VGERLLRLPGSGEREEGIEDPAAAVLDSPPKEPCRIRGLRTTGSASIRGSWSRDRQRSPETVESSGGAAPKRPWRRADPPLDMDPTPATSPSQNGYREKNAQPVLPPPQWFQADLPTPRLHPVDRSRWQGPPPAEDRGDGRCAGPRLEGPARVDVEEHYGPRCSEPRMRP
jgi:hypothetical protein